MQNLSPYEFCQFLGDLMVADVATGTAQDRYFCELATRVTTTPQADPEEPPCEPEKPIAPNAYEKALERAAAVGYKNADDAGLMAGLCDGVLQMLVGAVSPRLVWEGAQKKGLTSKELLNLCRTDALAVSELMWL